jgi:hypothetical protein
MSHKFVKCLWKCLEIKQDVSYHRTHLMKIGFYMCPLIAAVSHIFGFFNDRCDLFCRRRYK